MKVLISEDQPHLQTIMKSMMRKWGYEADITSNGLEAFNLAKEKQYDICIMDLKMPVMDGYEATNKIRNELPYLPILALTGNPESEKEKCFKAGMDDFLKKPFNISELQQKIIDLTVKTRQLNTEHEKFSIIKELRIDSEHFKELSKLNKKV
jgi:CheY-like chemotaxis protein